jgi:hypothetical protein
MGLDFTTATSYGSDRASRVNDDLDVILFTGSPLPDSGTFLLIFQRSMLLTTTEKPGFG